MSLNKCTAFDVQSKYRYLKKTECALCHTCAVYSHNIMGYPTSKRAVNFDKIWKLLYLNICKT